VKCDEAKPECNRCTSTGRTCEGYQQPKKERGTNPAPLLPRNPCDDDEAKEETLTASSGSVWTQSRSNTPPDTSNTTVPPLSGSLGFFITSDPKEMHFLEMFIHEKLPKIWHVELAQPEAWLKLMAQLIWDEPVVRHSAIALCAAHERQRLIMKKERKDPSKYAIEYYNRAIVHLLNDKPDTEAQATRSAIALLACCLLFVTMEMFLGRDGEVRTHLRSGVRIMKQTKFAEFASEEEQLLAANFEALDAHALMYPGTGRSKYDNGMEPKATELSRFALAPCFDDFSHAIRTYYQLCAQIQRYQGQVQTTDQPNSAPLLLTQSHLIQCLEGWLVAYDALKGAASHDRSSTLTGQLLEIAIATQLLCVRGSTDPTHMIYDDMVDDVKALLPQLRAAITLRPASESRFSVDTLSNELMCMWYLYRLCRDPGVRNELKGLLWKAVARRGAWCGMATIMTLERVRALEEEGALPEGADELTAASQIPSANRLAYVAIENNARKNHCKLVYRRVGEPVGVEHTQYILQWWH
jgi:Fungal specific transcription factor domain